jgi:hypothetical protein
MDCFAFSPETISDSAGVLNPAKSSRAIGISRSPVPG